MTDERARTAHASRVLTCWQMLELFSPQPLPKRQRDRTLRMELWTQGEPLPWESLPQPEPKKMWRHQVYVGVFAIQAAYETLHELFPDDEEAYDGRTPGETACAAYSVDQNGILSSEAATLSQCAWGLGRILRHGRSAASHLAGFDDAQRELTEAVDRWLGDRRLRSDTDTPRPLRSDDLLMLLDLTCREAGLESFGPIRRTGVWIRSVQVPVDMPDDAEAPFLNSFFVDDLRRVRAAVEQGQMGPALAAYLLPDGWEEDLERIDVRRRPDLVDEVLHPRRMPLGRWPNDAAHSLALSQQLAVNAIAEELGDGGLFAVNGPPGTGKTTMLRELVAANVVQRAQALARLARPDDAFTSASYAWKEEQWRKEVFELRPDITGYEMVVASSNNGAVENLSFEIPGAGAIDKDRRGDLDYFTRTATEMLTAAREAPTPAWALVAARMGRKEFRSKTMAALWWSSTTPTLKQQLDEWQQDRSGRSWADSVSAFQQAVAEVDALIAARSEAADQLSALATIAPRRAQCQTRLAAVLRRLAETGQQVARADAECARRLTLLDEARTDLERHAPLKPGFVEVLLGRGKAWRATADELQLAERAAVAALRAAEQESADLHRARDQADADRLGIERELRSIDAQEQRALRQLDTLRARFGTAFPDPDQTADQRELAAPWLDDTLNAARSDLFIAALQLHKDWLRCSTRVRNQLIAAMPIVQGKVPHDFDPAAQLACWRLFFLAVPVISTSFASYARMFGDLAPQSLGWMFIDEAGQCVPQAAVGAIWRTRNVVAVGDPLQLEPVVSVPEKIVGDIGAACGVGPQWWPPRASVQTLADRTSRFGTTLGRDDEPLWVGAPLRVHRRCDDPMFTVSNEVAYEGLMVSGVIRSEDEGAPFGDGLGVVPDSAWFDVPADTVGQVVQPQQMRRLRELIAELNAAGVGSHQIFAISPFRAVADEIERLKKQHPGLSGGTIHTAQGREADVVIFVLGTERAKDGSRAWAAKAPNLLNVAVSRAKRRLYVIGDHKGWADKPYFEVLGQHLPRVPRAAASAPAAVLGSAGPAEAASALAGPAQLPAAPIDLPAPTPSAPAVYPPVTERPTPMTPTGPHRPSTSTPTHGASRSGAMWDDAERAHIVRRLVEGAPVPNIAAEQGRTVGAIEAEFGRMLPADLRNGPRAASDVLRSMLPGHDWRAQRELTKSERR